MSKTIKNTSIILFLISLLFISCSSEDNGPIFTPTASNINATFDEYPANGTSVGTVATNLSGTLNYSITSQTAAGAFKINTNTGEVSVEDSSKFDYEINPILGATVSVTNSSETSTSLVSVELNNIDDIAHFLSTSKQTYSNANNGDWIKVTEEEYNTLAMSLNEVTKSGVSDEQYDYNGSILQATIDLTYSNDNNITLPANSYCFAFKYFVAGGYTPNTTKVKISSTSATTNYSNLGSTLPEVTAIGNHYYVLKGNDSSVTGTGYLGIYSSLIIGYKVIAESTSYNYAAGDASDINTKGGTTSAIILYQGLSTTQKQWD